MDILLILLGALKFIGVVILAVIGILIVLACIILFVPVKYFINAEKYESVKGNVNIKWLFGIVNIDIIYLEDKAKIMIKILGANIENYRKKKKKRKSAERRENKSCEISAQEKTGERINAANQNLNMGSEEIKKGSFEDISAESKDTAIKIEKAVFPGSDDKGEENIKEFNAKNIKKPVVRRVKMSEFKFDNINNNFNLNSDFKTDKKVNDETGNISENHRMSEESNGDKNGLPDEGGKIDLKYFKDMPWEEKKAVAKVSVKFIKSVFKDIAPERTVVNAVIGTGDPCDTGNIVAAGAVLKGMFYETVNIKGDFSKKTAEGNINILGSITVGRLVGSALVYVLSKPIRKIIKIYLKG